MWLAQFVCAPQYFKTLKGLCEHTVVLISDNLYVFAATTASKPIAKPKIQVAVPTGNVLNTAMKVEINDVSPGVKRKLDEEEYDMLE
jgi:hypothetical protein